MRLLPFYLLATSLAVSQAAPGQLTAQTNHWCGDWAGHPDPAELPSGQQLPRSDSERRFFVEPQLQRVPFQPIIASEPKVQLPKIWGNNKFRLALLSYATATPAQRIYASSKSRWMDFHKALDLLMAECVTKGSGGAYLVPPTPGLTQSTLVLYAYEIGSQFDYQLNYYMTAPFGLDPSKLADQTSLDDARVAASTA